MLNRKIVLALSFIVFYILVQVSLGQNETTKYTLNNLTTEILRNTRTAAEFSNSTNLNVNTDDNKIILYKTKRHRRKHRRKKSKQQVEEKNYYHVKYHTKFAFQNIDENGTKVKYNKSEHVYYGQPGTDIPPPETSSQPQENKLQQPVEEIHASHSEESCEVYHEAEKHPIPSHDTSNEIKPRRKEEILPQIQDMSLYLTDEMSYHFPQEMSPYQSYQVPSHHSQDMPDHHSYEMSPHHSNDMTGSNRQYEIPARRIPFYPEESQTHRRRHRHRHRHGKDLNYGK